MTTRHIAFFRQSDGAWVREWEGQVPVPAFDPALIGDARLAALNGWQQQVIPAELGEIGLDVTHLGWPVGDFCYCTFDPVTRILDWGPDRFYVEIDIMMLEVVANQRSHRPLRAADPRRHVIDITGTPWEPFHGQIFGRFVQQARGWSFVPSSNQALVPTGARQALTEAPIDLLAEQLVVQHAGQEAIRSASSR